jgi:hypothetical protein
VIDAQRAMPHLRWPAVLAGVAVAVAIALLSTALLPPIPAALATVSGLFISGLLAGKMAKAAYFYHGALVGAGYVVCEALGLVPALSYSADAVADTVAVIVSDALLIAAAALGGWCARLWSSSDRGTGR